DRDARLERRLVLRRGGEEDEQRPQPLAARERVGARGGDDARVAAHRRVEPGLELAEVRREPGRLADLRQPRHDASPTWGATIPPASRRKRTLSTPASPSSAASSSGPGKRRTLAGRYAYAEPPGSTLPSSGTTPSNQSR